ncbi:MAG: type II toxin-antitoxin system RelB/DinJ family antitoxin [Pseudomonadales bacterium]|nr:type II toxin-antitoxin system RelB/DinJ family antitoxin [Pseudomonadales bacterium]
MPTATANSMIHVRLDEKTKARAAKALSKMGMTVSDAVRIFLTRVGADNEMPFEIKVPNVTTRRAMAEVEEMSRTRQARFATATELFNDLEKNSRK